MKKLHTIALLAAIFLGSVPATADILSRIDSTCKHSGDIAYGVMVARQNGVALSDLLSKLSELWSEQPADGLYKTIRLMVRAMTIQAYETPRFLVEANKVRAAEEYRDTFTLSCYEILKKEVVNALKE